MEMEMHRHANQTKRDKELNTTKSLKEGMVGGEKESGLVLLVCVLLL
jgi:hypothetical protein